MNNLLTRRGGAVLRRCRAWISGNFGGSSPALCHTAAAVTALVAGSSLAAVYWPRRPGYAVLCCGVLAAAELGLWLAQRLLRRLLGRGLGWLMSLGLLLGSIAYTVKRGAGEGWTWRVWLFSALTAGTLWLLAASWWSVLRRRRLRPVTVSAALLSAGAAAHVRVAKVTNINDAIDELKAQNVWVYAADMQGDSLYKTDLTGAVAFVVGGEGQGVKRLTREKCDGAVSIPMRGKVNSLNASVAAGVAVFEKVRQDTIEIPVTAARTVTKNK